ncbi:BREX system P-loop protein BrxC [Polaribacter sp. Z014]|uniref:BREX system P-loop protein BrxC n=1 Tax=Polaribacter sp. Z014 TaxID=2927126 RepID=UPI00201FF422|nr:BREX system P-loop protein BrxC [Polaribacter sp. Z014]MCL7762668.1 BREX system P-loop protein BrxC [Polaribacter sp. Z014]
MNKKKMLLKEIYARKIDRDINPAVVVSNKNEDTIDAEIKEYVFTKELIEKLYLIVDTILNKKSGKSGIWINGYYGSGKSHFIKYVHYLLDVQTSELAFEAFEKAIKDEKYDAMSAGNNPEITVSNLRLLKKKVQSSNCDNIMFNVEDETDDGSQERLTRIFLNMLNKFRGYNSNDIPLAVLLEKQLDKKGVFEAFKVKVEEETGFNWETDAADAAAFQLEDVLEIAKQFIPELDKVSLHAKIADPENYKVGIKATLIPELQEFLKGKDKNYRLLFLVDEVSQYVGTNKEILLNFQNIIERVSNDCNNQVWIACTAQQTLDEVSGGADGVADVQDEFGKILGRFDTRISLQSNDASYITQRRVLDKNSNGIAYLTDLYDDNKDYIDNQFKINHDLYKGYKSIGEFIIGYPFVPYQFKLIAHVFEAFQQLQFVIKQVKDNERSILGITHYTAKEHADDEVGGFMPFDAFYNKSLETNLTQRGYKAIQNALELPYVQNNPFAQRVVKVLFMISNLLENQRQTFPSNVENLGVLLMDALDQNKKELQKEIAKVLTRLSEESIIREEKGSYFFFNEDEMDVQKLISGRVIGMDIRYTTFDSLIRPIINVTPKFSFGQNDFKVGYGIEGKEIFRNGDFNITVLLRDNTPLEQKALDINKKEIVVAVNEWFTADETLKKEFDWYCKTNDYFLNTPSGGAGSRSRTNENFRVRNNQLKDKLVNTLKSNFTYTRFVSQNNILEPSDVNGTTPADRFKNVIEAHLKGIYKYHDLSNNYARNQQELKKSVMDNQVLMETLEPAEQMVNDFISLNNNQITVYDLIKHFEKEPFGWRFEAVLDIVVRLEKKKKREFKYKNIERYNRVDFINKAVSTAERTSCEVVASEEIDQDTLDNVLAAYKNIFNEVLTGEHIQTDQNKLFDALKDSLSKKERSFSELESHYKKEAFGNCFSDAKKAMNQIVLIADLKKQFRAITEDQEQLKELLDTVKAIEDFAASSLSKYTEIKSFVSINNDNFKLLAKDDLEKVKKVNHFFTLEDPRKEFRHIVKAYDELEQAITAKIKELKDKAIKAYDAVFTELEAEATKRKVAKSVFSDKEYTLNGIKNLTSLSGLKSKILEVSNFKAKELEKIIKATPVAAGSKAAESSIYYVAKGVSTITTEKELEEYLLKLRREMLQLLKDKKNIIIK